MHTPNRLISTGLCLFFCSVLLFLVGVLAASPAVGAEMADVRIFHLKHRLAAELLPAVQMALSARGKVSVDRRSNTLVVNDDPDHLQRLEILLDRLDQQIPQVIVHLRVHRQDKGGRKGRKLSTVSGIETPGAHMGLSVGTLRQNRHFMVRVASGGSGYIRIARAVPISTSWVDFCRYHGISAGWINRYQTLESGLQVTPLVTGASVHVDVTPKLEFGQDHTLEIVRGTSHLDLKPGVWTRLAAGAASRDMPLIFLFASGGKQYNLAVEIRADVVQ